MFKALLVDDESIIRNGIKAAIPWKELEIGEVKTAASGAEALTLIADLRPEIVLTDIRMPRMDGLELLEQLKSRSPESKVIILSGFDEFSYAQRALKLGAFDYLLKTAKLGEIKNVIAKALNVIKAERKWQRQLELGFPLYREKLFRQLIYGLKQWESISEQLQSVGIECAGRDFGIAVIELEVMDQALDDLPMLHEQLNCIAEEYLGGAGYCFEGKYDELIWFCHWEPDGSSCGPPDSFLLKCQAIRETVQPSLKVSLNIGISGVGHGWSGIRRCYEEATAAVEHRATDQLSGITLYQNLTVKPDQSYSLSRAKERMLLSALRSGDQAAVLQMCETIFQPVAETVKLAPNRLHQFLMDLFSLAVMALREFDLEVEAVFGPNYLSIEEVKTIKGLQEAQKWLTDRLLEIAKYILEHKLVKHTSVVAAARAYIEAHYQENLTLTRLAEVVHMSPNYFSSVFSNEMGQSFLEYLTARRIEAAKQMLGDRDAKAFEVGVRVGYENPQYFSRIFKKYTGLSPLEYREQLLKCNLPNPLK